MAAYYDDPRYSYARYWHGRDYEHACEILALHKLLSRRHFSKIADVGGGYGRLIPLLARHAGQVVLVEPSARHRSQAKSFISRLHLPVSVVAGSAASTHLPSSSFDLVSSVRVLHHLPDLDPAIAEFARILKPQGWLLIEFANSANFKARLNSFLAGKPILPLPVDIRSSRNIRKRTIPFVNHHPHAVYKVLRRHGFHPQRTLSVSNFRLPFLKKILPLSLLLTLESVSQSLLAPFHFGPSIFVTATRI